MGGRGPEGEGTAMSDSYWEGVIFLSKTGRDIQPLTQLRGEPIQVHPLDRVNQSLTTSIYRCDVVTVGELKIRT